MPTSASQSNLPSKRGSEGGVGNGQMVGGGVEVQKALKLGGPCQQNSAAMAQSSNVWAGRE